MVQITVHRADGCPQLLVESPWRDSPVVSSDQHPVLAELDRISAWDAELKCGKVRSLTALAKREGMTTARVSQIMRLTRLSAAAVALLRERLAVWRGPKEAFSMRRLQELVSLREGDQVSAIAAVGIRVRRFRHVA
jgi:hypothetical protein